MPDRDDEQDPTSSIRGMRHTRRFLDKPVTLPVIEALVASARAVGQEATHPPRMLVIDELAIKDELSHAGTFSEGMTGAALAIVAIHTGENVRSQMNLEGRISDAIMREAIRHGLGSAYGYFHAPEAQERARDILGVPSGDRVMLCVAVGYVEDDPEPSGSSLQRARASLDRLSAGRVRPSTEPTIPKLRSDND